VGSDCAFGLQKTGGGDQGGSGDIGLVRVGGQFARSYVCAGVLPYTSATVADLPDMQPLVGEYGSIGQVRFGSVDYYNASEDFGLFAATEIKSFKVGKKPGQTAGYFHLETV
jgi:hypothetical protein